ncbi:MAG: 50S ribosomal protein L24 [Planctomycetes bacterium]|nr:50S ribosomal protein L24 [Planctomycetota bacterium]
MARNIRKGDLVQVIAGKGRKEKLTGKVLRILTKENRVLVEGVNVRRKNIKPTQANPQGGVVDKEMPIHISNVAPVADGKPTRVRFENRKDGSKVRIAVRTGQVIGTELRKARD